MHLCKGGLVLQKKHRRYSFMAALRSDLISVFVEALARKLQLFHSSVATLPIHENS